MADHLNPVRRALRKSAISAPPDPWREVARLAVGGLTGVGFERENETLLVTSANGQSVIDCTNGERLYRNRDDDGLGHGFLQAQRLDRPQDAPISTSGIEGGGLPCLTTDGWTCRSIPLDWPETFHILEPPGASIYFSKSLFAGSNKDATFFLMAKAADETRAFGFSWTGQTLIWACSSDLFIWSRAPENRATRS
ncbi:hypothetical protein [Gymnodinialimonas hymeniacidonis]|uniref:hypothetical protein n=1 Tax=Gymnodinialimonas hymeniacidonis TaxID=3126508 RepID=UPI0034C5DFA2